MNVYGAAGDWVFTEVRTSTTDFDTEYGGNRYLWFTNTDVAGGIALDSMTMSTIDDNPVQLLDGTTIIASFAWHTAQRDELLPRKPARSREEGGRRGG